MKSAPSRWIEGTAWCLVLLLATGAACQQQPRQDEPARTLKELQSGYAYQSADTQALQDDPFANPGMLWVDRGRALFQAAPGDGAEPCAGCHADPEQSLRGAATRYPTYDTVTNRLINLEQRINRCRTRQQNGMPLTYESDELLALTTFVAYLSRGLPFQARIDGPARPFFDAGRDYFYSRRGQLNLACHQCHEDHAGRMLRGDQLSQGHGTGYPAYRLEWQTLGSLHRRLRMCNAGIRAQPYPYGAAEYVNLELFLAWRAGSLPLESPAVRR